MLIGPDGEPVRPLRPEYEEEYRRWMHHLGDVDFRVIEAEIRAYCDTQKMVAVRYFASGEWTGTPYHPLIAACRGIRDDAAKFLGQILWRHLDGREDTWWFYHRANPLDEPLGMEYVKEDAR